MYFSYLNNGIEIIGGNESSITREFTTWDYGLVTGYENAVMINNNPRLNPGFSDIQSTNYATHLYAQDAS